MIFTSESVSAGHPDKVADQISDALLDAGLKSGDKNSRVAIETLVTTNTVVLAGEVKNFNVSDQDVEDIVTEKVKEIGYDQSGFSWQGLNIQNLIHSQSADIALGTDDFGAGDQGLMFGFATNATPSFLPEPIHYSHEALKRLKIESASNPGLLGPDAKAQVSLRYEYGKAVEATSLVLSTQHAEGKIEKARELSKYVLEKTLGDLVTDKTVFHLNPTGNFVIGGPDGDAGLTGRKIIVDTYGGWAPHGGGAFSGKDPTKVDRSAAYLARWLAKNVVAHGMASECTIQISYAIGVKQPTSVLVKAKDGYNDKIMQHILSKYDLSPKGIIDLFDLFGFHKYSENCVFGHFGDKDVPWEKVKGDF